MADATLDVVERVLDEVDKSRDVDWTILGERLRSAILDSGEHIDAGFTEAQKAAIVAVCRERSSKLTPSSTVSHAAPASAICAA